MFMLNLVFLRNTCNRVSPAATLAVSMAALFATGNNVLLASPDLTPSNWLASRSAPVCSVKAGVRSSRSDLVQFADVSASISAQSTREDNGACEQSASVWLTKGEISQQFDLPDASANTFSIVDFAPDGSTILLYKERTYAVPGEDMAPEIGLLSLASGSLQWEPVPHIVGWKDCAGLAEPEGFMGPRRLVFRAAPLGGPPSGLPACVDKATLLAIDLDLKKVFQLQTIAYLKRNGTRLSGPILSCQSDPDVIGACYVIKGRVALGANGVSMRLLQIGTGKVMDLGEGMLPEELSTKVTPGTWVYADMVICPLGIPKARPTVCIESASGYRSQAAVIKSATKAPAKSAVSETGASH